MDFSNFFSFFNVMFVIVAVFILLGFIFSIFMIFSSKFRGKLMSKQMKSLRYMTDYSKDDIEQVGTTLGNVAINTKKNILDANEDVLTDISKREANIKKEYVKTMASAIKEGLSDDDKTIYCKHCGALIDGDSKFCKKCGKEQ